MLSTVTCGVGVTVGVGIAVGICVAVGVGMGVGSVVGLGSVVAIGLGEVSAGVPQPAPFKMNTMTNAKITGITEVSLLSTTRLSLIRLNLSIYFTSRYT